MPASSWRTRLAAFRPTLPSWKGSCVVRQCFARSWWRQPWIMVAPCSAWSCRRSRGFSLAYMSGSTSPNGVRGRPHHLAPNPPHPLSSVRSVRPWALPSWVAARRHLSSAGPSRLDRVLSEPGALLGAPSNADLLNSFECRVTNRDVCCSQLDRVLNGYLRALPLRSTAPQ